MFLTSSASSAGMMSKGKLIQEKITDPHHYYLLIKQ